MKDYDGAIAAFESDIAYLNHDNPASLSGLGNTYRKKGNYEKAYSYLQKNIEITFNNRYEKTPEDFLTETDFSLLSTISNLPVSKSNSIVIVIFAMLFISNSLS